MTRTGDSAPATSRSAVPAIRDDRRLKGYFILSQLPFASLLFVLPLVVLYEVGTAWLTRDTRIIAFNFMHGFFQVFGATGRYLPAMSVICILLAWHIARNDRWKVKSSTLLGMALEAALLGLPLLILSMVASHHLPMTGAETSPSRHGLLVLSIGAGIYEELVFRLIAFTLLNLFLVDLLKFPMGVAFVSMVVFSSVLFSAYHYLGPETPNLRSFLFRTAAGIYFGVVFLFRGYGITAGAHTSYDIIVVLLAPAAVA